MRATYKLRQNRIVRVPLKIKKKLPFTVSFLTKHDQHVILRAKKFFTHRNF